MLSDAITKAPDAKLLSHHLHQGFNMFQHIPCNVSDLPNHDPLHTIQMGSLFHLQEWIFHFMTMRERLNKYNAIWLSVPAYHNLTPKNQWYVVLSQWTGKEMKEISQCPLGVVTQSLQGRSPSQHPIFNPAIECTQALLEFSMYALKKFHNNATMSYMEDALHDFHTFKDVSLLRIAGNELKAKANALRTELI